MKVIGLDGFRRGWVAVTIDGERRIIDFPDHIMWLTTQTFDRAAIDIPIGLCEDGVRACDSLARRMLTPHGSRVFGGARRWLWEDFTDPDQANRRAEERGQTKISRQLWHLGPKIMQVDQFLRARPHLDIRETHPELVFLRLNTNVPLPSKHDESGLALRRKLLIANGFADAELDHWLNVCRIGTAAKRDDVLDACAAAIAARDLAFSVPESPPPRDAKELPMQIWF